MTIWPLWANFSIERGLDYPFLSRQISQVWFSRKTTNSDPMWHGFVYIINQGSPNFSVWGLHHMFYKYWWAKKYFFELPNQIETNIFWWEFCFISTIKLRTTETKTSVTQRRKFHINFSPSYNRVPIRVLLHYSAPLHQSPLQNTTCIRALLYLKVPIRVFSYIRGHDKINYINNCALIPTLNQINIID